MWGDDQGGLGGGGRLQVSGLCVVGITPAQLSRGPSLQMQIWGDLVEAGGVTKGPG